MNTDRFRCRVARPGRASAVDSGRYTGGKPPLGTPMQDEPWDVESGVPAETETDVAWALRRAGFTLIELLAVVGIMALILVIALPAFDAFKLRGTQTAMPQINSTLRLARQYAITHRQDVYVVFPDGRAAYSPPGDVNKALCSYAVIASNRATGFEYVTEWKYLPKGVFFDPTISSDASVLNSWGPGTALPFPNDAGVPRVLPAVKFRPNGTAFIVKSGTKDTAGFYTWIPVTAGYLEVDTNSGTVVSSPSLSDTNKIIIANMTGQIYTE